MPSSDKEERRGWRRLSHLSSNKSSQSSGDTHNLSPRGNGRLIVLPPLSFCQNELLPSTTLLAGDHTATSPKMKASQLLIPGQTSSSRSHATTQDLHTNLDDSSTELLQSVSHADFKPPTNNRISPSSLQYQQHLVVPPAPPKAISNWTHYAFL